jgi:hypothetical protein
MMLSKGCPGQRRRKYGQTSRTSVDFGHSSQEPTRYGLLSGHLQRPSTSVAVSWLDHIEGGHLDAIGDPDQAHLW